MRYSVPIKDVKMGTRLECDGGFTCLKYVEIVTVFTDAWTANPAHLYVLCSEGTHYLSRQIEGDRYIGFRIVP